MPSWVPALVVYTIEDPCIVCSRHTLLYSTLLKGRVKMAKVAVLMGSHSDWKTMQHTAQQLKQLEISFHAQIISAHRTPDLLFEFAEKAKDKGYHLIVAGAGGAAHLPGMLAAKTPLPVIGVPIQSKALSGMDSLLSIAQMPAGIPVASMAIGKSGAINAALFAAAILATTDVAVAERLQAYRLAQTQKVLENSFLEEDFS